MQTILSLVLITIFLSSCMNSKRFHYCAEGEHRKALRQAVSWYRTSAEQKALYKQSYAAGTRYVKEWVAANQPKAKTWGVVLDIDETVLDNSWYFSECHLLTKGEDEFSRYIALSNKSSALPGAVAFTTLVANLGGYVALVSNRDGAYRDERGSVLDLTVANLKREGIVFDQVILGNHQPVEQKDKMPRFHAITTGEYDSAKMTWSNQLPAFSVIAYFGDNIQDFPGLKQTAMREVSPNDGAFDLSAQGYFLLPNPIYGSWMAP